MGEDEESIGQQVDQSIILHDLGKGILAGLVATGVAAILIVLKDVAGIVPEFNLIGILGTMVGSPGPVGGWIVFFAAGIALGLSFAVLDARVEIHPGTDEPVRGALFGVLIWLALMLTLMPGYGGGIFGMTFGIGAPITMLVINVVHGFLSGLVYGKLNPENLSDA